MFRNTCLLLTVMFVTVAYSFMYNSLHFYVRFKLSYSIIIIINWLRSTVGGTPVFGRRTDPVLRSTFSWLLCG